MFKSIYKYLLMGTIILSIVLLVSSYYMNYTDAGGIVSQVKHKKITSDTKYESSIEDVQLSFLNDKQKVSIKADTTKKIKDQVFLQNITGILEDEDGRKLQFKASKGLISMTDKKLYLTSGASMSGEELGHMSTEEMVIDYDKYIASTDGTVTIDNEGMSMVATGFNLTDKGEKLKFKKVTVKLK
jgi:LPS export ABC transporter protein LptC